MRKLRLVLGVSLGMLAVPLLTAPAALAAPDVYTCEFTGHTGNMRTARADEYGMESIVTDLNQGEQTGGGLFDQDNGINTDYNDGTYHFDTGINDALSPLLTTCTFADGDDDGTSGFYRAEFYSDGHYDNTVCGVMAGLQGDPGETFVDFWDPVTRNDAFVAAEGPLMLEYTVDLTASQGTMTINDATTNGNGESGSGNGYVNFVPTTSEHNAANTYSGAFPADPAPNQPPVACVNGDVTNFQLTGAFTVTIDG